MTSDRRKINAVILFFILVISCGLMIYFCAENKYFFHGDEVFSYGSANHSTGAWIEIPPDAWSGKEIWMDYVTVSPDSRFHIMQARRNQGSDTHPPVYYMLLHCICSLFPGVFSKWFGLGLNIAAMLISVLLLYYIMRQILWGGANLDCTACRLLLCSVLRHDRKSDVHKNVHSFTGIYPVGSVSAPCKNEPAVCGV